VPLWTRLRCGNLSAMDIEIASSRDGARWPDAVGRLLLDLPEWFGIEQSVLDYIESARTMPTTVARRGDEIVGACLVRRHNPVAAEIELLAVSRSLHRRGIGRRLLDAVEDELRADGVRLVQVKTFGPSGTSAEYERTRAFYASVGYVPLEERTDIWGPGNPCLISVKPISRS
jgi:ribosomal protein S18 acetylase RimI-like enzyme